MTAIRACVGLGGNVGNVARTLAGAFDALGRLPRTRLLRVSRLYRTPAWGHTGQPDFLNAAAVLDTALPARGLLDGLLAIERGFGRKRDPDGLRWGPRTLDLDLLLHGDAIINHPALTLPHPRMHERAFVLAPLAEIAPSLVIPGRGPVAALLAACADQRIHPLTRQ